MAAEAGLASVADRRAVSFWLAGRRPRAPVPELLAEALSRGLGRRVDVTDVGMSLLAVPSWTHAAAQSSQPTRPWQARGDERVTAGRLDAAEQMAWLFTDNDSAFGGGYARGALGAYLAYDVAYAIILRAMSVQARMLGHRQHAVQLAETAVAISQRRLTPMRQAFLLGRSPSRRGLRN